MIEAERAGLADTLAAMIEDGTLLISTSTSFSLTLRSKYAAYLNMVDGPARRVAHAVVDVSEFLLSRHAESVKAKLKSLRAKALYHGPCQLRGHNMGQPAIEMLRMIPDLEVHLLRANCCVIAGTYGYSRCKADIARAVGQTLIDQVHELQPDVIICDSESCRWSIAKGTVRPTHHPVEIISAACWMGRSTGEQA